MARCPSSSKNRPPSYSSDPKNSSSASRRISLQRVATSSNSSSERGSRTSTSERSLTSRSTFIVTISTKQDRPSSVRGSRLHHWLPWSSRVPNFLALCGVACLRVASRRTVNVISVNFAIRFGVHALRGGHSRAGVGTTIARGGCHRRRRHNEKRGQSYHHHNQRGRS